MGQAARWGGASHSLDAGSVRALLAGEIPAIHVDGFASVSECEAFRGAVHAGAAPGRAAATSPMTVFGGNLSNFRGAGRHDYFRSVEQSYADVAALHAASFDPLPRVIAALAEVWDGPVDVAREPGPYGRYFAGGVKSRVEGSALHYDFVPYLLEGFEICRIVDQFSWNLYVEVPPDTGATTLYDAMLRERPPGQDRALWDNLLAPQSVAGARAYTFMPREGELVLLNTRCPHSIEVDLDDDTVRRTQIGSFVGRMPDDALVLWS